MPLYRIEMTYMCAGVVTNDAGIVITTAPILKWTLGKNISQVEKWCRNHKAFISFIRI